MQAAARDGPGLGDCLTLNVWRPAAASDAPLPVMVWIHGGAMVRGKQPVDPGDAVAARARRRSA